MKTVFKRTPTLKDCPTHYCPGCGHGVVEVNGVLLLGIWLPDAQRPAYQGPQLRRANTPGILILDENQCAICSVTGHHCTSADSAVLILTMPLVDNLPAVAFGVVTVELPYSFHARAPPLV